MVLISVFPLGCLVVASLCLLICMVRKLVRRPIGEIALWRALLLMGGIAALAGSVAGAAPAFQDGFHDVFDWSAPPMLQLHPLVAIILVVAALAAVVLLLRAVTAFRNRSRWETQLTVLWLVLIIGVYGALDSVSTLFRLPDVIGAVVLFLLTLGCVVQSIVEGTKKPLKRQAARQ